MGGSGVLPELAHRQLLDPAPGLRPLADPALFHRIGGRPTVDLLVDALYDRFEADRVMRPLFGKDLSTQRSRQKVFFAEWLGGPPGYSESAWGGLYRHHEDLPITPALAERWLDHLRGAVSDTIPRGADAATIVERARGVALALVNHSTSTLGGRVSKHRSEQVASCGVGARTLKQAGQAASRGKLAELESLVVDVPEVIDRPALASGLLQDATLNGRAEVVCWLVDRGVDVNGPAPLPVGMIGGSFELVFFVTPLCAARLMGRSEIATTLSGRGALEDIFTAAFLGDLPLVQQFLAERPSLAQVADPADDVLTITPLHHAIGGGQLPALRLLLDYATEPVRTGSRALRGAAAGGNVAMVDLLLEHGADGSAVGAGAWVLNPEIAPHLAAAGASAGVGISGQESGDWVRISCTGNKGRKDNPEFVAALLRYGARVDQRYKGATPLHYAVKAGFVRTTELLLSHGADGNAVDDHGRAPIDWLEQASKTVDKEAVRRALRTRSRSKRPSR